VAGGGGGSNISKNIFFNSKFKKIIKILKMYKTTNKIFLKNVKGCGFGSWLGEGGG
jgi:hypothetical protein